MAKKNKPDVETVAETKPAKFTKQQLVKSKKYGRHRDVLNALLKDGGTYTHEQVEEKLKVFLKGKVKK